MAHRKFPRPTFARPTSSYAKLTSAVRRQLARRLPLTVHALERAAERDVSMRDVQYILCFGRVWRAQGRLRFELRPRHAARRPSARGVVVAYRERFVRTVIRRGV